MCVRQQPIKRSDIKYKRALSKKINKLIKKDLYLCRDTGNYIILSGAMVAFEVPTINNFCFVETRLHALNSRYTARLPAAKNVLVAIS